ncbi:MAG: class I SAM-dependent methyltransferase [Geodermatophilaceae bacterium]|nr:class I SAM-dependent methyltransferase [Geodermatophilaceae bacterium]
MTNPAKPVADALRRVLGDVPVAVEAFDGSLSGPPDAGIRVRVRSPRALNYLITSPGELGLARAFVAGDLEVDGDLHDTLELLTTDLVGDVPWLERLRALQELGLGTLRPLPPPPEEVRLHGWRHSKRRDSRAISHHYDVSNRFYEWVLGPSMAYTCAVFPTAGSTLEQAQEAKHDLVARKLGLAPGMRLLDVGCGWGGMVVHAAQEYGAMALGVTLSRQQAEFAQKRIADLGLSDLAEVRYCDYRDVEETGFDAVSSIGLTEHVGQRELPLYFTRLYARLRPGGRMLNHCITRPTTTQRVKSSGFIPRYVFPDGELMGVGAIASVMQNAGFELRHMENLREHYALTLDRWCANLDANWDDAVAEVGANRARVWSLYMAGSQVAFEHNHIQLHQLLGVRTKDGVADYPLRAQF